MHATPELVRGIGVITPPRKPKASRDCWTTGRNARTRTVGIAPGSDPKDGPSMRVTYADGHSIIQQLSSGTCAPLHNNSTTGSGGSNRSSSNKQAKPVDLMVPYTPRRNRFNQIIPD